MLVVSSGSLGVCEEGCLCDRCGGTIHSLTVVQIVVGACVGCLCVVRFVCVRHGTWCETNMFSNPVEEHTLSSYHHAVLLAYRFFLFCSFFLLGLVLCWVRLSCYGCAQLVTLPLVLSHFSAFLCFYRCLFLFFFIDTGVYYWFALSSCHVAVAV